MAISQVRVFLNGSWHTLTESNGTYTGTITAPGQTSFNLPGKYYNMKAEARNDAGTVTTVDGTTLSGLQLVVKERIPPKISVIYPSNGSRITNNSPTFQFSVSDEPGGSGINTKSCTLTIDTTTMTVGATPQGDGTYLVKYQKQLSDGTHTFSLTVQDNDGNKMSIAQQSFIIDTIPPTLNITSPSEGLITNNKTVTLSGITNDATSSPVTVKVSLNNGSPMTLNPGSDGRFTTQLTLKEGQNTIKVVARDSAGKESTVTRTVKLDTSVPKIVSATITPNPVDAGKTMSIKVVVE